MKIELPPDLPRPNFIDYMRMVARVEQEPDGTKKKEIVEHFVEIVRDPAYELCNGVRARAISLKPKRIVLPQLATQDDRVRESWAQDEDGGKETWGQLYAELALIHEQEWTEACRAFEQEPWDFCNAYHYLDHHPAFWSFYGDGRLSPEIRLHHKHLHRDWGINRAVSISVVKVDPVTGQIEDDETRNTLTEVWLEAGKIGWPREFTPEHTQDGHWHDPDLDTGGETFEEAIINLAVRVHTRYGNDRRVCDEVDDSGWDIPKRTNHTPEELAKIAQFYQTHDAVTGARLTAPEFNVGSFRHLLDLMQAHSDEQYRLVDIKDLRELLDAVLDDALLACDIIQNGADR